MRFYKIVAENEVCAIGTGLGGIEIQETEYNALFEQIKYIAECASKVFSHDMPIDDVTAENRDIVCKRVMALEKSRDYLDLEEQDDPYAIIDILTGEA